MTELESVGHRGFEGLVGVARRDITPDLDVRARCWGPARHDLPVGVHRPLTLTAMALRAASGGSSLLLITADLSWFRRADDERRVREPILRSLGLPVGSLVFHIVHTHAGPSLNTDEVERPGGDKVGPYLDSVAAAAVSAGAEAMRELAAGTLEWASGRCGLAADRDLVEAGRALVGYSPAKVADDTLLVGRVSADDGKVMATIVNYACHPTTLAWQNRLLSPDYVGAAREVVEAATGGAPCLFLQGASGELAPRHQYVGDTEIADRHGRQVGHAAVAALSSMLPPRTRLARAGTVESGAPLAVWQPERAGRAPSVDTASANLELPVRPLPSLEELAARWSGIDRSSLEERLSRARSLRSSYEGAGTISYPLWCWRLGDSYLVAHPGEAYSALQRELRQRHGQSVAVLNLSNGPGFFYFPDQAAYDAGTYSSWQTLVDRGSLEALIEEASSAIASLSKDLAAGQSHAQVE
jgi:hypothetical protein